MSAFRLKDRSTEESCLGRLWGGELRPGRPDENIALGSMD